jgi:hypothetical protein
MAKAQFLIAANGGVQMASEQQLSPVGAFKQTVRMVTEINLRSSPENLRAEIEAALAEAFDAGQTARAFEIRQFHQ